PPPPRSTLFPYTTLFRSQAIEILARSDKQGVAILPAKANVGCPRLFNRHVLNLLSGPVEDRHSFAGQIDIAFRVERHAIRAELRSEEHTSELQSLAYLVC